MAARPAPSSYYDTSRRRHTLDSAWQLVEANLPHDWRVVELCYLADGDGFPYRAAWYAAAGDPTKPDGEHIEGTDRTPVHALLRLARLVRERKHRIGRPPKAFIPPSPPHRAGREGPYRSPDIGMPASVAS